MSALELCGRGEQRLPARAGTRVIGGTIPRALRCCRCDDTLRPHKSHPPGLAAFLPPSRQPDLPCCLDKAMPSEASADILTPGKGIPLSAVCEGPAIVTHRGPTVLLGWRAAWLSVSPGFSTTGRRCGCWCYPPSDADTVNMWTGVFSKASKSDRRCCIVGRRACRSYPRYPTH